VTLEGISREQVISGGWGSLGIGLRSSGITIDIGSIGPMIAFACFGQGRTDQRMEELAFHRETWLPG
jgi:hypothetical protein